MPRSGHEQERSLYVLSPWKLVATTVAAILLLLPLGARVTIAQASSLKAGRAWVSLPLLSNEPAQAYFTLQNRGSENRKHVGAESRRAERVEIHQTTVFKDGQESTEKMEEWEVPKGGRRSSRPAVCRSPSPEPRI